MSVPELILASASPRRKALLEQVGLTPVCQAANVDESSVHGESSTALVMRLALSKASAINRTDSASSIVLGADTVIDLDGQVLGKPVDERDSVDMLMRLADTEHSVISGVCVRGGSLLQPRVVAVSTLVRFGPITPGQAHRYWQSREPFDKAGSYAIQGLGAQFVAHISGSYSNVVGLPLYETLELLRQAGLDLAD